MPKICNRHGDKEPFDEEKLYNSILNPALEAGYDTSDAADLAETIIEHITDWVDNHEDDVITSKEVRVKVMELLEEKDGDVAFMYDTHLDIN